MARILLAWELGGGLGHVQKLAPMARALAARGHDVVLALRDPVVARSLLRSLPFPVLSAPVWLHRTVRGPPASPGLADVLLDQGYLEASTLEALVSVWRGLVQVTRADAVVGDYAPTGMLAARSLGVAAAGVGSSFTLPPRHAPLPLWQPRETVDDPEPHASETRLKTVADRVLERYGASPLEGAWQLLSGDRSLVCSWPELDVHTRASLAAGESWHGPMFDPDAGQVADWPAGDGPAVFVYLKGGQPEPLRVLDALLRQGCRVCAYLPDVAGGKPAPLTHAHVRYAKAPVHLASALAEARLCVSHAGAGLVAQALLAGVPHLLLPTQREQSMNALRVRSLGAGRWLSPEATQEQIDRAVRDLVHGESARDAARAFAARHPAFDHAVQVEGLADAVEKLLAASPG